LKWSRSPFFSRAAAVFSVASVGAFIKSARDMRRPSMRFEWEIFLFAWPIALSMLGDTAMGVVDTKFAGGLGEDAIGAVGLGAILLMMGQMVMWGVMRSVKVRIAHCRGEGRPAEGSRYLQAGLVWGFILGMIVFILFRDIRGFLGAVGVNPRIIDPCARYVATASYGAAFTGFLSAFYNYRQGYEDSITALVAGTAGNILNAVLAWAWIYGHLGFSAYGVAGAGAATSTSLVFQLLVFVVFYLRAPKLGQPTVPFRQALVEVTQLGLPTGLQFGLESLAFCAFTAILASIPETEFGAHQIALTVLRTSFLPGIAIAEATSVVVARSLGERQLATADRYVRAGLTLAIAFMSACGIAFFFGGLSIARWFSNNPLVVVRVAVLLKIGTLFQAADAINIVMRGALRGAQDVRFQTIAAILLVWGCTPSCAYILGRLMHWGAVGGWIGFVAEATLCALVFSLRWRYGRWRKPYAPALDAATA
jgi:MATE family multidrug resistance protein